MHHATRTCRAVCAGMLAIVLVACSSSTPPIEVTQDALLLRVDSASITVGRGRTRTVVVSVTATGTSDAPADLVISPLPVGVSAVVTRLSAVDGAQHFRVAISAESSAAPGNFLLQAVASRAGATSGTTDVMVIVPDIGIIAQPSQIRVHHLGSNTTSVRIFRPARASGDVLLSVEGNFPDGLSATVTPNTLVGNEEVAEAKVSSSAIVAPRFYDFEVVASGAEYPRQSQSVSAQVYLPFRVSLSFILPSDATVSRGQQRDITLVLVRDVDFVDDVQFSVTGLPAGVASSIVTINAAPLLQRVRLTVGPDAPVGTFDLTLTATSIKPPIDSQSATIKITITP